MAGISQRPLAAGKFELSERPEAPEVPEKAPEKLAMQLGKLHLKTHSRHKMAALSRNRNAADKSKFRSPVAEIKK